MLALILTLRRFKISRLLANRAPVALCSVGARRGQHAATSNVEHKALGQGRTVWPRRTLRCGACCRKRTDSAAHRFRELLQTGCSRGPGILPQQQVLRGVPRQEARLWIL
ncbi:uncharacterized protein ACWYII_043644 isoform 1-T1 [Salvelinus alpinus]